MGRSHFGGGRSDFAGGRSRPFPGLNDSGAIFVLRKVSGRFRQVRESAPQAGPPPKEQRTEGIHPPPRYNRPVQGESGDPFDGAFDPTSDQLFAHARAFEDLISRVYERLGCRVVTTAGKREFGADFIARYNQSKIAVQVKCSARSVGVNAVRQAAASRDAYSVDAVHLVTNSIFTGAAESLAGDLAVKLISRHGLLSRLELDETEEFMRIDREAQRLRGAIRRFRG